jgi:hypothetical protein
MSKWFFLVSAIAVQLISGSSCAQAPHRAIAWDGLGRDPNLASAKGRRHSAVIEQREHRNAERQRVLQTLRPYSKAWWAIHDEMQAEDERDLASKLVICRGCVVDPPQDATGSIR